MSTKLYEAQAALAAMFDAALSSDVKVFIGPRTRSGAAPRQFVLVGADGGDTGLNDGLTDDGLVAEQSLSAMGNGWVDESGSVRCAAWAWTGDGDFASLRTQVQSMYDLCAATVRADRALGGVLATAGGFSLVESVAIREAPGSNGLYARALFTVAYTALITT